MGEEGGEPTAPAVAGLAAPAPKKAKSDTAARAVLSFDMAFSWFASTFSLAGGPQE